jgi:DNA-binding transcriptional MocR family regulator
MSRDVVLAPGNVFSVTQSASDFMRFNVAQCDEIALDRFAEALRACGG